MVLKKKKKPVKKSFRPQSTESEVVRVRVPKNNEVLGILDQRLGGSRAHVRCLDGKTRNCRIPGRLKKKLWVRPGDVVLIEPWEFGGDEKGDIIFKYKPNQVNVLRKKGLLKQLDDFEEF
ncbi:MAG: translation initiation factor eIF-1A [Candidatus Woesearchaeota archaeon]